MDIDIFANIDSYLNADYEEDTTQHNAAPLVASPHNQSAVLSDIATPEAPQPKRKIAHGKQKKLVIEADDEDDAEVEKSGGKLIPGIGQKTAVRRFEKIRENLKRHMNQPSVEPISHTTQYVDHNPIAIAFAKQSRQSRTTTEIIDLSDEDECNTRRQPTAGTLDVSLDDPFEEENYIVHVKVKWCSEPIETVPLRRHQPLADLCAVLADRHANGCAEQILLLFSDRIVRHDETLDSMDYTIGKWISARIVKPALLQSIAGAGASSASAASARSTAIELKIQSALWKRPIVMSMEPSKKMMVLVILCAQQLKCPPGRLRLRFDGEALDLNATAAELDLEGGEVMDLWMADE